MTAAKKTSQKTTTKGMKASGFTEAERAAMKERAEELKAERGGKKKAEAAAACLAKIAEMPDSDRVLAERVHAIVTSVAPELSPKTWYGMPAYANADGKNVVFFQPAAKFEARYATLGFEDAANLDDGTMWATSYALSDITDADAKKIEALVRQATS